MSARRRLLILTYEYPPVGGGTGKAAMNTARQLARAGFDVTVATSRFSGLPIEERIEGVRIIRLPVLRRERNRASAHEMLSFAPAAIFAAKRLVRVAKPDLTLAYMTIPCGVAACWIKASFGVPFLCLLRGQDVPGHPETPRWMQRAALPLTRHVWHHAERVIANSEGLAELARERAGDIPIHVIRNGVDADYFAPHVACPTPSPHPVRIAYAGRLVPKKHLAELIQAGALLRGRNVPPFEIHIAGYGPERPRLEQLARELKLEAQVRLVGQLDKPGLLALLQSADIFVNASSGEGLPNAVLEAMACGIPTTLSDIPPHRELVGEGEHGTFFGGPTPEAIAAALEPLVASPQLRATMGTAARRRVLENFSWEGSTRELIRLTEKCES